MTDYSPQALGMKPHTLNEGFEWQDLDPKAGSYLSESDLESFNRDGYCVLRNVFSADEIAAVTAAIDPLEKAQEDMVREAGNETSVSMLDTITFTTHLVRHSDVLSGFAKHAAFQGICGDIIGDKARLYWDQSVYKKSGKPEEFPWHQDNGYTFIRPQQYVTCWVPLVDVRVENGCPWIAPGLHREGTYEHWFTPIGLKCVEDVPNAVPVEANAGDIVVFSSLAPHRTGPNLVPESVRKAYILQFAPDGAMAFRDGQEPDPQNDPDRQFLIND